MYTAAFPKPGTVPCTQQVSINIYPVIELAITNWTKCLQHVDIPRPGIEHSPQQGPDLQWWPSWTINPLSHKGSPVHAFLYKNKLSLIILMEKRNRFLRNANCWGNDFKTWNKHNRSKTKGVDFDSEKCGQLWSSLTLQMGKLRPKE